jgi:Tol biopolymer transport system component
VSVTAPPRPPRPTDPVDRDELEALVNALIEEARRRAQRRRRIYAAVVTSLALVAVGVFVGFDHTAQSQSTSLAERSGVASAAAGSRIAFMRGATGRGQWAVFVMNADGTGARRLASSSFNQTWSPDGRRIAVQSERNGRYDIDVMDADGGARRTLVRGGFMPVWSPDGRKIAFRRGSGFLAPGEIHVMNADGSGQRKLTRQVASNASYAWSPDGRKIAFARQIDAGIVSGRQRVSIEIYVMNADGSGLRNLTHSPEHDFSPAWSPDGREIVFVRSRATLPWSGPPNVPGDEEIYVMNADGSDQRNLTRTPGSDWSAAWSPDGREIVFVSSRGPAIQRGYGIYLMDADGSHLRRLVRNGGKDPAPAWSPDGRKIAFTGRGESIYLIGADGDGMKRLTQARQMMDWVPVWSPGKPK